MKQSNNPAKQGWTRQEHIRADKNGKKTYIRETKTYRRNTPARTGK